jgi:nitroreductase
MDVIEAILNRRSIRLFKPQPVPREILQQLIETSRWSPSGSNSQPWELAVLGGPVLDDIKAWIVKQMPITPAHPDIPYPPMPEPYRSRQVEVMKAMNAFQFPPGSEVLPEKRAVNRFSGGQFFGAPNAIIVSVDKEISPRAFIGLGMLAQTICLAALNYGLGSCIMSMVTYWPEIYRDRLAIPDTKIIAFGIALGYPDTEAKINRFPRSREPLDAFVHWYGV